MKRVLYSSKAKFITFLNSNIEINSSVIYNFLRKNEALPLYLRQQSIFTLYKINQKSNISKLLYVCINTGKSRAVMTNYKLSNLSFKLMLKKFIFSGLTQ